jgi:hypothetical protein
MRDQVKTWTALAAAPLLAAAFALPVASHAAELHNNGVPGVDMNVSGKDHQPASKNGVPGVDVDVSSHDRGSSKDQGVPGVNVNTKTSGANSDQGTATHDTKSTYAEKTTTHTFHHKTKARHTSQPKADRN